MRSRAILFAVLLAALLIVVAMIACSGSSKNTPAMSTVNVRLSDPSTCSAPKGPFSHIYITVADVKIHTSSTASDSDSGWIDLAPGLTSSPMQVDLLALADNPKQSQCFLATLGANQQLQAGTYQQIRVFLLDNSKASQVKNNACGNVANCVVLAADGSINPLQLSSEVQTGIKIPSGQIAGGQFTIGAGQSKDLDIDFNACASMVMQGNGLFRLKPVLHAGEVSLSSSSINGHVVKTGGAAIVGGKILVVLESQNEAPGIDRVIMETMADDSGNFTFCPVTDGKYDVVAFAVDGSGVAYAATIATGVQPGTALGDVPMVAQTGANTGPASINGQVTTATAANAATSADVSVSALQQLSLGGSNVMVTIPALGASSATPTITTAAGTSCPANTNCASYTLQLPAAPPNIGTFNNGAWNYAQSSVAVSYTIDALAFLKGTNTPNCSPSEQKTTSAIAVTAGTPASAPTLSFTGCAVVTP